MKRETITLMLNGLADEYISEAAAFCPASIQESPERIVHMNKKRIITFALAAALILALGAVAYAADLFGLKALLITNGSLLSAENANGGRLSITQPQAVPEEMDSAIREKIDNSSKAWAEWRAWCEENAPREPESCRAPENASGIIEEKNEDGTVTFIFLNGEQEIERRIISAEDYQLFKEYWDLRARGFSGYDFNYHIYTKEMADKLEEIAARYGLKLRHKQEVMLQDFDEQTDFYSFEEITSKINEICAGGKSFFRTEPTGYDKFYYFDEGTFAVSFYTGEDQSYTGTNCYLYNSPYGTLSSGYEIFDVVKDVNAFTVRSHTTPDGAELTVLQNGTEAFAYIYLENSFVTLHVSQIGGMSDAEIDAVLDMVDFSTIR